VLIWRCNTHEVGCSVGRSVERAALTADWGPDQLHSSFTPENCMVMLTLSVDVSAMKTLLSGRPRSWAAICRHTFRSLLFLARS
jgi:hypothetical protein